MTDSLPARVARLEASTDARLAEAETELVWLRNQLGRVEAAMRVIVRHRSDPITVLAKSEDTTREATLREIEARVRAIPEPYLDPVASNFETGASAGRKERTEEVLAVINALLTAPAPQPPEPERVESHSDLLNRMGTDAAKWAAEFRQTALRLGYSDMDEGWLIGWFANAIVRAQDEVHQASDPQPPPADGLVDWLAEALKELYETHTRAPQHDWDFGQLDSFYRKQRRALVRAADALTAYEQERERAKEGGDV